MQQIIKLKKKLARKFKHNLKHNVASIGLSDFYEIGHYYYIDYLFKCTSCSYKIVLYRNGRFKYQIRLDGYNGKYEAIKSCAEVIIKNILE